MSKILLRALLCVLSSSCLCAMDYMNAMLMYKHKPWQPALAKEETQGVPTLEKLVQKRIAQLLLSTQSIEKCSLPGIFESDNPAMQKLVVTELLKGYASKIAAAHITPKRRLSSCGSLRLLRFNNEGNLLAGAQRSGLYVWDVITEDHLFIRDLGVHIDALCFAHRSKDLAIGSRNFEGEPLLLFFDITTSGLMKNVPIPEKIKSLCFSADDKTIAVGTASNQLHVYDKIYIFNATTGQQLYVLPVHTGNLDLMRTLRDSLTHRSLAIAYKHTIPFKIISFDTNKVYLNYLTRTWRFQPDQEDPRWHTTHGHEEKIINTHEGYYMWGEQRSALYDCITDQELCNLDQLGPVKARVFSGNGNRLAVMSRGYHIQIYDCPTYKQVISQLNVLQATFLAYKLQHKEQEQTYSPWTKLSSYFKTSENQQDVFQHVHNSLPGIFQKMIE